MAVTTQKEVELYKFSECTFDWRSDQCNKSFKDAGRIAFISRASEAILATAGYSKCGEKWRKEEIGFIETYHKSPQRHLEETVQLIEFFDRRVEFSLARKEAMEFMERRFMGMQVLQVNLLLVEDALSKESVAYHGEVLQIVDHMLRQAEYERRLAVQIGMGERADKQAAKNCSRRLALKEIASKKVQLPKQEAFSLREAFLRNLLFQRDVKAALRLAEKVFKRYAMHTKEAFAVRAAFLRACNAVLSNIGVAAGEMSLEDFMEAVDRPAKYDRFCDFNVGEYEYQKALVRFILVSMAAQAEPVLYDLTVHVDIDDTNDRGIATIADTSAPTKVRFNKFYYHPPEVNVTLKGGNTADGWIVPCLIRTDGEDEYGRYFEVELRSSGQRVTGTVSWTAKGY